MNDRSILTILISMFIILITILIVLALLGFKKSYDENYQTTTTINTQITKSVKCKVSREDTNDKYQEDIEFTLNYQEDNLYSLEYNRKLVSLNKLNIDKLRSKLYTIDQDNKNRSGIESKYDEITNGASINLKYDLSLSNARIFANILLNKQLYDNKEDFIKYYESLNYTCE